MVVVSSGRLRNRRRRCLCALGCGYGASPRTTIAREEWLALRAWPRGLPVTPVHDPPGMLSLRNGRPTLRRRPAASASAERATSARGGTRACRSRVRTWGRPFAAAGAFSGGVATRRQRSFPYNHLVRQSTLRGSTSRWELPGRQPIVQHITLRVRLTKSTTCQDPA